MDKNCKWYLDEWTKFDRKCTTRFVTVAYSVLSRPNICDSDRVLPVKFCSAIHMLLTIYMHIVCWYPSESSDGMHYSPYVEQVRIFPRDFQFIDCLGYPPKLRHRPICLVHHSKHLGLVAIFICNPWILVCELISNVCTLATKLVKPKLHLRYR